MPYSISDPPNRIKKLPKHAQEIWISAYNNAIEQYDGDEERANKVAWGAVKRGYKQVDGKWVKKMDMKYLSMAVSKVVKHNGVMHFETTVSDDDWDSQDERLALELFEDFISREEIKRMEKGDSYEPPFLSISHYNQRHGDVNELWVQGNRFKTRGIICDDRYGRALFKAVIEERLRMMKAEAVENPIKLSIGFYPYATRKEDNKIVYIKGEFHHEAATRVPINERTSFDEVTEKSMGIRKKDDAASIIGEDLAEELEAEERSRREKGDLEEGLIIKAEEDSPLTELQEMELKALLEEEGEDPDYIEKAVWSYDYKKSLPDSAYLWVEHGGKCKKKDGQTPQACRHLPYKGESGKVDCGHLRAAIQAVGGARTGKPMSVPSGTLEKAKRLYSRHCTKGKALVEIPEADIIRRPYGGAVTIADAVSYMEGQEAAWKLNEDVYLLKNVLDNILQSEEVEDKKAAIVKAVSELNVLLASSVKEEKMDKKKEEKLNVLSLVEGIKDPDAARKGDQVEAAPEEPTLDTLFGAYKAVIESGDLGRQQKIAGGSQCLRLMAAAGDKIISDTTPRSEADVVADIIGAIKEELVKPIAERLAVLEARQKAGLFAEPVRKGITVVEKAPSGEEPLVKKGSLAYYARQMSGLDPETGKALF